MTRIGDRIALLLVAPWILVLGVPASATAVWTSGGCAGTYNNVSCAPSYTGTNGTSVTVTAISDTGSNSANGTYLASAYIGSYSGGYGVTSAYGNLTNSNSMNDTTAPLTSETTSSPEHSMDNYRNIEYLLYSFAAPVSLNQVTLGWTQPASGTPPGDSDISVLAFGSAGGPGLTSGTRTYSGLVGNGWQVIGNYSNVCPSTGCGPSSVAINSGDVSSSYWLIGAYNSVFKPAGTTAWTTGNDYVKLLSVAGNVRPPQGQTPEPSSMLLFGIGLLALTSLYRRRVV